MIAKKICRTAQARGGLLPVASLSNRSPRPTYPQAIFALTNLSLGTEPFFCASNLTQKKQNKLLKLNNKMALQDLRHLATVGRFVNLLLAEKTGK